MKEVEPIEMQKGQQGWLKHTEEDSNVLKLVKD